jgi:hypothetical protein
MRRRKFWGIQIFISGEARFFRTVWGATLRLRLPALRQLEILFADSLDEAAQATAGWRGISIDLLLWCASDLPADAVTELKAAQAAQAAWQARLMAMACRFAGTTARDALVNAGASVVRELSDDGALVAWRSSFGSSHDSVGMVCSRAQTGGGAVHGINQSLFDDWP